MTSVISIKLDSLYAKVEFDESLCGSRAFVKVEIPTLEPLETSYCRFGRGEMYWHEEFLRELTTTCPWRFGQSYMRMSVYSVDSQEKSTFLGDSEVDLVTLLTGPAKQDMLLSNSRFKGTVQFRCACTERGHTFIDPVLQFSKGAVHGMKLVYFVDTPAHEVYTSTTKSFKKGYKCPDIQPVIGQMTLEELLESNLVVQVTNQENGSFVSELKFPLSDLYYELEGHSKSWTVPLVEGGDNSQTCSAELTLLAFPAFMQTTGVNVYNGLHHEIRNACAVRTLRPQYKPASFFNDFQPVSTLEKCSKRLMEPAPAHFALSSFKFVVSGGTSENLYVVIDNSLLSTPLRVPLRKPSKASYFVIDDCEYEVLVEFPHLLNRRFLTVSLFEGDSGLFLGDGVISLHTLLAGPKQYEFSLEHCPGDLSVTVSGTIESSFHPVCHLLVSNLRILGKHLKTTNVRCQLGEETHQFSRVQFPADEHKTTLFVDRWVLPAEYVASPTEDILIVSMEKEGEQPMIAEIPLGAQYPLATKATLGFRFPEKPKLKAYIDVCWFTNDDEFGLYAPFEQHENYLGVSDNVVKVPYPMEESTQPLLCRVSDDQPKKQPKSTTNELLEGLKVKGHLTVLQCSRAFPRRLNIVVELSSLVFRKNHEVLCQFPYAKMRVRAVQNLLFIHSPLIQLLGRIEAAEDFSLQITHQIGVHHEEELMSEEVDLATLKQKQDEEAEAEEQQYRTCIREDTNYFLICNCSKALNITCPLCRSRPDDFNLYSITRAYCTKCYYTEMYSYNVENPAPVSCPKCGEELMLDKEAALPTFLCHCGRCLGATCGNCHTIPERKDVFQTLVCDECNSINIVKEDGCLCKECQAVLPSLLL